MRGNVCAFGLTAVLAAMLAVAGGCKGDQPKKNYKGPFEGTALQISPETNEVSMKMVSPEQGITVTQKGYVNDKTQVEINGMTARLEDIHPGDPVKVTGYYETVGDGRRFVVTNISVHRQDNDWVRIGGTSSAPTTQAAD